KSESGTAGEIVFAADDDTFRISPGPSDGTLWLHEDGAVTNILLRLFWPGRGGQISGSKLIH
ncbi:MAG TPA: hypothetical protein VHC90_12995, partial [Bryobacteraceae bacterium]|nr:hypothetical protein [Bryobacteraceae bacterium]